MRRAPRSLAALSSLRPPLPRLVRRSLQETRENAPALSTRGAATRRGAAGPAPGLRPPDTGSRRSTGLAEGSQAVNVEALFAGLPTPLRGCLTLDASRPVAGSTSRREFLSSSGRFLGAGWLAAHLPALAALSACSREAAERGDPFTVLTPGEGETMAAFAELILPSDDLPGAREAGVTHFVDGALGQLFPDMLGAIRPGLADLDERAAGAGGNGSAPAGAFATIPAESRAAIVREIEDTPFFFLSRMLVVMGMFSDPVHGGNRGEVGWDLLRMAHAPMFEPPFGHYDAGYPGEEDR
jgi:gluconate 2-dehydrogenase gamma chain